MIKKDKHFNMIDHSNILNNINNKMKNIKRNKTFDLKKVKNIKEKNVN